MSDRIEELRRKIETLRESIAQFESPTAADFYPQDVIDNKLASFRNHLAMAVEELEELEGDDVS